MCHFLRIFDWELDDSYNEDWPHACSYIPLIKNWMIELFQIFTDHTVADDICYFSYDDHRQTRPLDDIASTFDGWFVGRARCIHIFLSGYVSMRCNIKGKLRLPNFFRFCDMYLIFFGYENYIFLAI